MGVAGVLMETVGSNIPPSVAMCAKNDIKHHGSLKPRKLPWVAEEAAMLQVW